MAAAELGRVTAVVDPGFHASVGEVVDQVVVASVAIDVGEIQIVAAAHLSGCDLSAALPAGLAVPVTAAVEPCPHCPAAIGGQVVNALVAVDIVKMELLTNLPSAGGDLSSAVPAEHAVLLIS